MPPASDPSLIRLKYSKPLFSDLIQVFVGPFQTNLVILLGDRRFNACDVSFIAFSFKITLNRMLCNLRPVEMDS